MDRTEALKTTINLNGISYPARNGVDRLSFDLGLTALSDYVSLLSEEWIRYTECHQCGRWKHCAFGAPPHPGNPRRSTDVKCGVAVRALEVFLAGLSKSLKQEPNEQQAVIDAAYHIAKYVELSEQSIGSVIDDDVVRWYGDRADLPFFNLYAMRGHLNGALGRLQSVSAFQSKQAIVIVEGESELAFLLRMRTTSLASFMFQEFDTYRGKGNVKKARIEMLVRKYESLGYTVYIQGDADGADAEQTRATLAENLSIARERIFIFEKDFESSVPIAILGASLAHVLDLVGQEVDICGSIESVGLAQTVRRISGSQSLDGLKVELAAAVADNIGSHYAWWLDEDLMTSELGKFLTFIEKT